MSITPIEVEKISKLAKLQFDSKQATQLSGELSAILDYVEQLNKLEVSGPGLPEFDPDGLNLMRDDVAESSAVEGKFLSLAPAKEGEFLKVKSILE